MNKTTCLPAGLLVGLMGLGSATFAGAEEAAVPPEVAAEVAKVRPEASIVSSRRCALGSAGTDTVGLLLRARSGKDPFSLHMAIKGAGGWTVSPLPGGIDYARGGTSDILSEWTADPERPYEILCTAIPNKDLSVANNGAFVAPFSKNNTKGLRHLCFQASMVYNSYSCFSMDKNGLQPKPSFVQLNAD